MRIGLNFDCGDVLIFNMVSNCAVLCSYFFLVLLSTCYKLKVEGGVYWFHLVRRSLSVSHVMLVSKFKKLKFWRIFKICNFDFVFFWLGIQYYSIVWVIMRQQEYHQNAGILGVLVKETLNHKYMYKSLIKMVAIFKCILLWKISFFRCKINLNLFLCVK